MVTYQFSQSELNDSHRKIHRVMVGLQHYIMFSNLCFVRVLMTRGYKKKKNIDNRTYINPVLGDGVHDTYNIYITIEKERLHITGRFCGGFVYYQLL